MLFIHICTLWLVKNHATNVVTPTLETFFCNIYIGINMSAIDLQKCNQFDNERQKN